LAGCDEEATRRAVKFLNEVLNTKDFPLTVMDRPIESESCKIVENSHRATILAFLNERSVFAERNGVDLTSWRIHAGEFGPDSGLCATMKREEEFLSLLGHL
jgi:UDP-N-acetyl-D-mannosaminuronate dehydrogenase